MEKHAVQIDKETLDRLINTHIRRYELRLACSERGDAYVNVDECKRYLDIWKSVQKKAAQGMSYHDMAPEECAEILDGYYDELE